MEGCIPPSTKLLGILQHKCNEPGFKKLINKLKNKEQFWETISEIEFNAYFSKRYTLQLEPKIYYEREKYKQLDSKSKIKKRDIYFEIFTPKVNKKLPKNKVIILLNRSKNKILDKLKEQIIPLKEKIKNPIVIVINTTYSEIDEFDIENSLLGESRMTLITNSKTGQVVNSYPSRADNSLIDANPLASLISAVIVYRRHVRPHYIKFEKSIIFNKKSDFPLTSEEYKALNRFNLSTL